MSSIIYPVPEDEQQLRAILAFPDGMDGRGKLDPLLKLVHKLQEQSRKEVWEFVAEREDWCTEELQARARWEIIQIEEDLM